MYSKDLKQRAINLYHQFKSFRIVENILSIGKSTIHRWVNNIVNIKKTNFDISKLITYIEQIIKNNSFITLNKIKQLCVNHFKMTFSCSLIYTIIIKKSAKNIILPPLKILR